MSSRDRIVAAAEQFGWTGIDANAYRTVFVRTVPMCDQRDEYRVVCEFINGRISEAFYGPDRRPHDLNSVSEVVRHLVKWATE